MSAPKFYAAVRPSGRIAAVRTSKRKAMTIAGILCGARKNSRVYGSPATNEWRKAKAAGWSVQGVTVRF